MNGLERLEDPAGDWRWYVNRELGGHYQALFAEVDLLVMLRPPDLDRVYAWREEQEARLRAAGGGPEVMTPSAVPLVQEAWAEMFPVMRPPVPVRFTGTLVLTPMLPTLPAREFRAVLQLEVIAPEVRPMVTTETVITVTPRMKTPMPSRFDGT